MTRRYISAGPLEPFELDGYEYQPNVSLLDLMELVGEAFDVEMRTPAGVRVLHQAFKVILGEQYAVFAQRVRENGTRAGMLIDIFDGIMGDAMGPPSQPSTADSGADGRSAGGRPSIGRTSVDMSSSDLDLTGLGIMVEHRLAGMSPERQAEIREAVAKVEATLTGSQAG